MPDLLPLDYSHLYLLPEPTSRLFSETSDGHVQGKPLRSAERLIVLVHGWNPDGYSNKFAPDETKELSARWAELANNLDANPIIQQFGWTVARYDWARDADTGAAVSVAANVHGDASRDAASAHGSKLGQAVQKAGATHVQFLAHSSGAWAVRRAAAYLKRKMPSIHIQITALDPNVNDIDPTGEDDVNLQPAFELTDLWTDYRDNFYVVDGLRSDSRSDAFLEWTSGDFTGWNNANIEFSPVGLYESWMKNHAGPVSWYAKTADEVNLSNTSLLSANIGFLSSLPVRFASAANDNFPGQLLSGDSRSTLLFNYQATAQPSEPEHAPLSRAARSVWAQWKAPTSGTVTFDTFGADFYNVLAAYSGASLASLKQIAHDDSGGKGPGQCEISFAVVAQQTYYIAVDGLLGQAGQSPLHWRMSGSGGPVPTVSITAPAPGATVNNVTTVSANGGGATKVEFYLDDVGQFTDSAAPFTWTWNTATAANAPHALSAKSYSGTTLLATSAKVTVTVNNSSTPPIGCLDTNEPNDSSLAATPLVPGANVNGYICSAKDVDWFKVTAANAGTLTLNLTVPAQNDYDLEIWGQGQSEVPAGLNGVVAIAAGSSSNLALVSGGSSSLVPFIQAPPQSHTVSTGQSPSFIVTVRGTPPFTYQWLRNGAPIAGATSATLTVANAQPAQAGNYTVQVIGPGGTVTSAPATLAFVTDSNGNGMPDTWETAHALALNNPENASADPDHDGASNWQEYLAGTDPQIATSIFHVTTARVAASGFQLSFTTVTGKTYRIEWASNPSGPWTVLENNIPGSGDPIQITDNSSPASATRFYRVVAP